MICALESDKRMGEDKKMATGEHAIVQSHDRWVSGKSEADLLADLKTHLALLKDNPRSLPDRLRVAAIQLRLGRIDEALIHYEGVVGGYVAQDQVMSAVHLCERLLAMYPDLPRIKQLLAALYARVPRKARTTASGLQEIPSQVEPLPAPVTEPVDEPPLKEVPSSSFKLDGLEGLGEPARDEGGTERFVMVDRLFPDNEDPKELRRREQLFDSQVVRPVGPDEPEEGGTDPEDKTTERYPLAQQRELLLLTKPRGDHLGLDDDTEPDTDQDVASGIEVEELSGDTEREVVLLDKPKKKG